MTAEHDPRTRLVLSWLREDAHENAENVLQRAMDEVATTPQRRSPWTAMRTDRRTASASLLAGAAAVLVVAVVGLPFLASVGTNQTPPTPRLPLLARGLFTLAGHPIQLGAVAQGSTVTGRLVGTGPAGEGGDVDLQCTRTTEDGLILIGGFTDTGRPAAIALRRGSPVQAVIWSPRDGQGSPTADCQVVLDELMSARSAGLAKLEPIDGFVELGVDGAPLPTGLPLLARGEFVSDDGRIDVDASGQGGGAVGRLTVTELESDASYTVDLQCTETNEDGVILLGGYTIGATGGAFGVSPAGHLAAIALERGAPAQVAIWAQGGGPTSASVSCLAFLDVILKERTKTYLERQLGPITGTVEFGPDQPTPAPPSEQPTPVPTASATTSGFAAPPSGLAGNGAIALAKDGDIYVADTPGGAPRPLVTGPAFDSEPKWSPDGTRLVFQRETDGGSLLMVADADGTKVDEVMSEPLLRWSVAPDSRSVIGVTVIDEAQRVIVRPLDPAMAPTILDVDLRLGGQELFEWEGPTFRPTNAQEILLTARLEPDGPRGIYVYDLATGEMRSTVEPAGGRWLSGVTWSPTGEDILYGLDTEDRIVGADGSGDRVRDDAPGEPGDNQTSPWSNDGTKVVVNREAGGIADGSAFVVSTNADGRPVELACGPTTDIPCAESWIWSPDDSMLIGSTQHEVSSYGGPMETFVLADPVSGTVTDLEWDLYRAPTWQRVAP